jgi:hypothetical protein
VRLVDARVDVESYSARLVALLLAAVLPVVAIASVLAVYVARQERGALEAETQAKVARVVDLVGREITADLRVLEALATSACLGGPDLARFHDEARRVLASQPDWLTVILLDLGGWQLLSARQPPARMPAKVIEPQSFEELLRTGGPLAGHLSEPLPVSGLRAVPLRVPVRRDGQLRYVLTAPMRPDSIGRLLARNGLIPEGWIGRGSRRQRPESVRRRERAGVVGAPGSTVAN